MRSTFCSIARIHVRQMLTSQSISALLGIALRTESLTTVALLVCSCYCLYTQCPDAEVRKVAYECISNIASMYYSKLQPYMHVLFDLTIKTAKEDEVSLKPLSMVPFRL
jgi:hypothetical protein